VLMLKIENAAIITLALCIALSFYFVILSFQTVDETLRRKLTTLAVSFLIASIVIFISLMIYSGNQKHFSNIFDIFHFLFRLFLSYSSLRPSRVNTALIKQNKPA